MNQARGFCKPQVGGSSPTIGSSTTPHEFPPQAYHLYLVSRDNACHSQAQCEMLQHWSQNTISGRERQYNDVCRFVLGRKETRMAELLDPEEAETRVIHKLLDFTGKDVLDVGC